MWEILILKHEKWKNSALMSELLLVKEFFFSDRMYIYVLFRMYASITPLFLTMLLLIFTLPKLKILRLNSAKTSILITTVLLLILTPGTNNQYTAGNSAHNPSLSPPEKYYFLEMWWRFKMLWDLVGYITSCICLIKLSTKNIMQSLLLQPSQEIINKIAFHYSKINFFKISGRNLELHKHNSLPLYGLIITRSKVANSGTPDTTNFFKK